MRRKLREFGSALCALALATLVRIVAIVAVWNWFIAGRIASLPHLGYVGAFGLGSMVVVLNGARFVTEEFRRTPSWEITLDAVKFYVVTVAIAGVFRLFL